VLEFARQHALGLVLAGVLHAAVIGGLVFGMLPAQPKMQEPAARAPVQAMAVSEADLRAAEQRKATAQAAEQRRRQEAEQQRQAEIRRQREEQEAAERARVEVERARVAAEQRAVAERQAQERRAAEEARRVEEARRAEAARQAEEARKAEQARIEAAARAKAEAEARVRAEAEARRKAEEAARAEAARQAEARAQAERQRQLSDQIAAEQRRMQLQEGSAYQLWLGDIQAQVTRNWNRPPTARAGLDCQVRVSLIPGMQVVNAEIVRCNGDDAVRRSIIAAVERASPLPRPPDAALFERTIVFDFKPED
jgi:colicin import membrane protein